MADTWVGTVLQDKWRIDGKIARGGVATVFRATHRQGQVAAIKIMHPELARNDEVRKRFLREGYVANKVGHPGVVRILDDDVTEGGSAYIVMELLDRGETLEERREKAGGKLKSDEVGALCIQILDVLAAAHEKGIVHRDIKPENIYVLADGTVKVLDFGIAHMKEAAAEESTATGLLLGTPEYMSPEQALGKRGEIDAKTDIYALGAMMFTLLSAEAVHPSDTLHALLGAAATRQARTLASVANGKEIPPALVAVVDKALALEKHRRWASARAMQDALRVASPEKSSEPETPRMIGGATERVQPPSSTDPVLDDGAEPSTVRPTTNEVAALTRRSSDHMPAGPMTAAAPTEAPTTRQPDAAPPRLSRPAPPPMRSRPSAPPRPAMPSRPPPAPIGARAATMQSPTRLAPPAPPSLAPVSSTGVMENPHTPRMAIDAEPPSLPTLVDPPETEARPAPPSAPPPSAPTAVLERNRPPPAPLPAPATVRLAPIDPEDGPTQTKLPETVARPDADDFDREVDAEGPTEATIGPPVARPPPTAPTPGPPRPPIPSDSALMQQKTTAMIAPTSLPPSPQPQAGFPMTPQQPFVPSQPFPAPWSPPSLPAPIPPPSSNIGTLVFVAIGLAAAVAILAAIALLFWFRSH